MALWKAVRGLIGDWSLVLRKAFKGFLAKTLQIIFGLISLAVILSIPHLMWPQMDIKMLSTQTWQYSNELTLTYFELENDSLLDLKDPEITCDMKGASGTTIAAESKTLYEVLESGKKRPFSGIVVGKVPDQATQFNCYVKRASIKW